MTEVSVPDYYGTIVNYADSLAIGDSEIQLDVPEIQVSNPVQVRWTNFFKDFGLVGITAVVAAITFLLKNSSSVSMLSAKSKNYNKIFAEYQELVHKSNQGRSPTAAEIKRMKELSTKLDELSSDRRASFDAIKNRYIGDKPIEASIDELYDAAGKIGDDYGDSIVARLRRLSQRIDGIPKSSLVNADPFIQELLQYLTQAIARSSVITESNRFKASSYISAIRTKLKEGTSVSL